ncbi:GGDEF domain-containing protein [uncultured Oceanisphaera sp.]|uniref:GGDEF domain-containing protein n=1 Tax=uncultured Oceanisphaera sp. TaxID=353858 RepID=UPI002634CA6B|nr:GGDEF domain-containing protein [uncultured Oceanisphaera sp.]
MDNIDNNKMLMELASVIDRLEAILGGLQQQEQQSPASLSGGTFSEPAGRLISHWQKLFVVPSEPEASPVQSRLLTELEQQLARLRQGHARLSGAQQLNGNKLQQVAAQLQQSPFIPAETQARLAKLKHGNEGHEKKLWRLLDCYQTALHLCTEQHSQHQEHYHELCSRLQQLIAEFNFAGEVAVELDKIQRQLSRQTETAQLPGICLRLIELTIEGCRCERKNSTLFLTKLHSNLGEMQHHFAISLSEGQALFDARTHHGQHIAGELRAIGEHLVSQDSEHLKEEIELRMRGISHILVQHERLQEREQSLLKRMNEMDQQIQSLKSETVHFKQQLRAQNEKLFIDSLTQIHNRAGMDARLEIEYRRWLRYQAPLCIALIDIDYFKEINDKYGHLAGDKALRLIARTIQQSLRESDFVARFGGEEFIVLLNNIDPAHLKVPLEKLREQIKNIPFRFKEERVTITASIGATLFRQGDSITSALERTDQALYRAKHAGRDQIVMD